MHSASRLENTMSTIVVPNAGSTASTVVTDNQHQRHDNEIDRVTLRELLAESRVAAQATATLQLAHATDTAALQKSICDIASAAALTATTNTAAIQTQAAECCCKTNIAIRDSEDRIKAKVDSLEDRINNIEMTRQAVLMVDLKTENAFLRNQLQSK